MNTTQDGEDVFGLFPELAATNEARRSLSWFLSKATPEAGIDADWRACRARMLDLNTSRGVMRAIFLEHDFWLCKRANPEPRPEGYAITFLTGEKPWHATLWQPPEDWRLWPTFGVEHESWLAEQNARQTRALDVATLPAYSGDAQSERSRAADMLRSIVGTGPRGVLLFTQASAWIDIAIGRLGRLLHNGSGDIDPQVLLQDFALEVIGNHTSLRADMMEDSLQILYGSVRRPDGRGLYADPSPRGQSFEWRDYFRAVGADLDREHVLASVQLAALMLRSESVWAALATARQAATELLEEAGGDEQERGKEVRSATEVLDIVMCVRRRWQLALRALVWLETSLQRANPFAVLRPADLACFAITSLLPLYPRSLVVVSHRSCDVKEQLLKSKAWRSNEVLIDANFRPEWQTNRAMVWSLFSATPVISKIQSERYSQSHWCNREAEMFAHLCEQADFLEGRQFFEIGAGDVAVLEKPARSSPDTNRMLDIASGIESPPFELTCWPSWQGAMLRAGAAARLVLRLMVIGHTRDQQVAMKNASRLIDLMARGDTNLPAEPLFGFENFWTRLGEALRADGKAITLAAPLVTLTRPKRGLFGINKSDDGPSHEAQIAEADAWFQRHEFVFPNPAGTDLDPADLFAALDWRAHLEHFLISHNENSNYKNQGAFIDLRGVTKQEWTGDPGWTVARGLIYLRLSYPLIIRQLADQGVEDWPMIRDLDLPIYTQHTPEQLVPQSEVFFSLGGPWPAAYVNAIAPPLTVHPFLYQLSYMASKSGDDPVLMRADGGLDALSLKGDGLPSFAEWLQREQRKKE